MWHSLIMDSIDEIEAGVFVSTICEWAKNPVLGGNSGKGFGLVDAIFYLVEGSERIPFVKITDGNLWLSETAQQYRECYDKKLEEVKNDGEETYKELIDILNRGGK